MKTPTFGYETGSEMKRMQRQGKAKNNNKKRNKPTSNQNITSPKQKPLTDKFSLLSEWLAIHVNDSGCESCGHSLCTGKCY